MTETLDAPAPVMPALHPVFARQIDCLMRQDWDGLMNIYHPEVETIRFLHGGGGEVLVGRQAIADLLKKYQDTDLQFVAVLEYAQSDSQIMTRTAMSCRGEEIVAVGCYVIKDDMIWRQFGCDEGGARNWWA